MVFTQSDFFLFTFGVVALDWFGPKILPRTWVLLAASWAFYCMSSLDRFVLLLLVTTVDFTLGQLISRAHKVSGQAHFGYLLLSVVLNIGILAYYKLGWVFSLDSKDFILPIGISFYTFQSLSYTIDVYQKRIEACTRFDHFALYVAFFPQLIAGPIERAQNLIPQLLKPRALPTRATLKRAAFLIGYGILKKVAIADKISPYTRWGISDLQLTHGADVWLASASFILEFLIDFSAYTDIALGLGLLFGVELTENFRYPYFATNPREFWRRWHITLGHWFRDYVYRPLISARWPQAAALLITMTLVGFWHQAQPRFILWGFLWGLILLVDHIRDRYIPEPRTPWAKKALSLLGWVCVQFLWITLGFLFVARSIPEAKILLERAFHWSMSQRFYQDLQVVLFYLSPFLLLETAQFLKKDRFFWFNWPKPFQMLLVSLMMGFLLANSGTGGQAREFIYFAF